MAIDQSAFQMQGAAGGAPAVFYAKAKDGSVVEVEVARDSHRPPAKGFYPLKLKALSAPFEMDGTYGRSRNVRAIFQVTGGAYAKQTFSQLLSIAKVGKDGGWHSNITTNSGVGKMIAAIRGKEIGDGEPINLLDYLNGQFAAIVDQTVKSGENGVEVYGNVVKDTWAAATAAAPVKTAPASQPAPAPTNGHNPFLDDDD